MPKVFFDQKANRELARLPNAEKKKVLKAIELLQIGKTNQLNLKKMKLAKGKFFRIRLGNIRIIYEQVGNTIYISTIGFRGSIY